MPLYDSIGHGYRRTRSADPRITDRLFRLLALDPGSMLLDVGAGTGNYSAALAEKGLNVTALEPSAVMREQGRTHARLQWVEGYAEDLPFPDESFQGAVLTLCLHHLQDWRRSLHEAFRVVGTGPVVILTYLPDTTDSFWLFDYFPLLQVKDCVKFPRLAEFEDLAGDARRNFEAEPFPLPPDLKDNFAAAGWAHPEFYLERVYRAGISTFSGYPQDELDPCLERLRTDLDSGAWDAQYGALRSMSSLDVGYIFGRFTR